MMFFPLGLDIFVENTFVYVLIWRGRSTDGRGGLFRFTCPPHFCLVAGAGIEPAWLSL